MSRASSFCFSANEIIKRFPKEPLTIVETGTIRNFYNDGDGWSTLMWQDLARNSGGQCWTCDVSRENLNFCRTVLKTHNKNDNNVSFVECDSVQFLKLFDKRIHLLYLDSLDTDEQLNCCVHQVNEAFAAINKIYKKGLVLIDDIYDDKVFSGKGRFSVPFLLSNGFKILNYD